MKNYKVLNFFFKAQYSRTGYFFFKSLPPGQLSDSSEFSLSLSANECSNYIQLLLRITNNRLCSCWYSKKIQRLFPSVQFLSVKGHSYIIFKNKRLCISGKSFLFLVTFRGSGVVCYNIL